MTQGGARARSGPPPDPNALRRERDRASWTHLPAAGRQGDAPAWPLGKATARERSLWAHEWARPQAIEWERLGIIHEVAIYVRTFVNAERPKAPAAVLAMLMRQQEALGLSIPGLARHRWVIDADVNHADNPSATAPEQSPERPSVRDRLRVVAG
jgi:hypothetical protein